jgi:uncharacterized Zn-finger protein
MKRPCDENEGERTQKKHRCNQCEYVTATSSSLTVHQRRHTGEKPFKCDYPGCDSSFATSGTLTTHQRRHTGEKPFKCDYPGCDSSFATSGALTVHQRRHTGEKPFKCDYPGCDSSFATSGKLIRHQRTHTGEKPFKCDFEGCDSSFSQSGNLTVHQRRHRGEKPFKCDHPGCDSSFSQSHHLTVHQRTHTGEKPFKCDYPGCEFASTTSGSLTRHQRSHTGEKPFKCDFEGCGFAAAESGLLTRHQRRHTGERPYKCTGFDVINLELCSYAARTISALKSHYQSQHTKKGQQRRKRKEEAVKRFLRGDGFDFESEVQIGFTCADADSKKTCSKLDVVFDVPERDLRVILEIDEEQHRNSSYSVSCDVARMMDTTASIRASGEMAKLLWIRFNPDGFKIDGKTCPTPKSERYRKLADVVRTYVPHQDLAVMYLFYDMDEMRPTLLDDPEYSDSFKPFVILDQ